MEYWIWLRGIKGIGPSIEKRLLRYFGDPKLIYEACEDELISVEGIGKVIAKSIVLSRSLNDAYSILEKTTNKNIKLLTYNDPLYPSLAKEYSQAPTLLYYRGNIKENLEGIAIVGSRRCSNYGKDVSIEAAEFLAHKNIPVISGMAKGIDGYAHTGCLKSGGYTIAFLGNGVDICYPSEHAKLMDAIIENGAVISEYLPGTKTRSKFFPERNSLISSWSKKVLVVEAAEKSGALITADFAKKLGREVLVTPHEIHNITGKGSNRLIFEGSRIYQQPSQLLFGNDSVSINPTQEEYIKRAPISKKEENICIDLSPTEKKILSCIMDRAKTIEEIGIELNINQVHLIEDIATMELEGKIKDMVGGRYKATYPANAMKTSKEGNHSRL